VSSAEPVIYGTCAVERLSSMKDVLKIQDAITKAARKSLEKHGFLEILPPVISPATDPGLRGAKRFDIEFYGKQYKLTGSMIMHKIIGASAIGKVYAFSPCLRRERPEKAKTGRHLAEFWQIDVEMPGSKEEAMEVAEQLLFDVIKEVKQARAEELEMIGSEIAVPTIPLRRIKHDEAVKIARELGFETPEGEEISHDAERALSLKISEPFFIVDYPRGSRGFYDKIDTRDSKKLLSFDLIYPRGFGEALSGSEREYDAELVKKKLAECGEDPEAYKWFTELLDRKKIKATAGFGFGLERMTRYICGLESVEQATPFPKMPGGEGI
jgi:asparaginyl-tRNA synthetase